MKMTREESRAYLKKCVSQLKPLVKRGDRLGVTACPGTKRVITFECWDDGNAILSKSNGWYAPQSVYSINGKPFKFAD